MPKRVDVAKRNAMLVDLLAALNYNKDTGDFVWKEPTGRMRRGGVAGCIRSDGYVYIRFIGTLLPAHGLAWAFSTGSFPIGEIDHINHDCGDNRIINLREVSRAENSKNLKLSKNNTSGIHGVYFHKLVGKWVAQISINGVQKHLGYYSTTDDAAAARREAEKQHGYHENHGCKSRQKETL